LCEQQHNYEQVENVSLAAEGRHRSTSKADI
jgi:hypothetical protein